MNTPQQSLEALKNNTYPGRGLIIGASSDRTKMTIVYWIMGRGTNSRNRIFVLDQDDPTCIKTQAYDPSKLQDPSLIIYNVMRQLDDFYIVTNGDQTDTIYDELLNGRENFGSHLDPNFAERDFYHSLQSRDAEPDKPNFTPRISGMITDRNNGRYILSIIKRTGFGEHIGHYFYSYQKSIPGIGHCLTTYIHDGKVLPSFIGEPIALPLFKNAAENLEQYINVLSGDNLVSLAVRTIDRTTGETETLIHNVNK